MGVDRSEADVAQAMAEEIGEVEARLDPGAPPDYRSLAAELALAWRETRPRWVGLGGGQGAGKSTLAALIESACAGVGLRAIAIGLDDFYRTKAERQALARTRHPLFETRGPPGTHDVAACERVLDELTRPGPVALPRFDKGRDDRGPWVRVAGPFDLILLEGWCVGARPAEPHALAPALNALERDADPDGRWRRAVNEALAGDYARLWSRLDERIFLAVPDLDAVRRWRLQQEAARPVSQRLEADAIDRFVQHYERITLRMLEEEPAQADWVVRLDAAHRVSRVDRASALIHHSSPPSRGVDRARSD